MNTESKAEPDHKHRFSCLQYDLPRWMAEKIITWGNDHIPNSILYQDEPCYGREDRIHCTVFYGIHTSSSYPLQELLSCESGFSIELGKTSCFQQQKFDVVKIDVAGGDLYRLHQRIGNSLDVTEAYDYRPHVTVAYVRSGFGPRLIGSDEFEGQRLWVNSLRFSSKNGDISYMGLRHREPSVMFGHKH